MQSIGIFKLSVDDVGVTFDDLPAALLAGIRYYVLRSSVNSGGVDVRYVPPGISLVDIDIAKIGEKVPANGQTVQCGPFALSALATGDALPAFICATGESAVLGITVYALTDEQP